ncbi:MAG: Phosphoenolpyruvate carboxylase [Candidatus Lokiarchaeum sp. GC14_75]|nr:MAG: Phosphoenolpyruvate carboxylase [Candidatus Lokiarchaeum sp. GC14_75]HEC36835.1 phosphoenolpyruvate carboxylase [bacterium]
MVKNGVKIPRCMSTQHPDNVNSPFFVNNAIIGGEDEIKEAYYAFSHLGCDEQMWDCEGKEVDSYVVKKLLTKYKSFFSEKTLGKDLNLTLRGPNPSVERAEAKVLLEALESIPRSFDAARLFYNDDIAPIFEVILPMTASSMEINNVYRYYSDIVVGKETKILTHGKTTIGDWIGEFKPKKINVIPLFEDIEHMLNAHDITRDYLQDKNLEYQRVFLARSDPALNYGLISAVLLNKVTLQRLYRLSEEINVEIYPIIGAGSSPFRGNLRPQNVENVLEEYPSVSTFTIQSAFKYDNPPEDVIKAINKLQKTRVKQPQEINEERCLEIINKYLIEYQKQVVNLAPVINDVARYVPSRRKRKLHIGLFGYSRNMEGIALPRAIKFTAALYSLGLPPEILGLNALNNDDFQFVSKVYVHFEKDLKDSLKYLNIESRFIPKELKEFLRDFPIYSEVDEIHKKITEKIQDIKNSEKVNLEEYILSAANIRKFLG